MERTFYMIVDNRGKVVSIHYEKDIAEHELEEWNAISQEFGGSEYSLVEA